MCYKGKFSQVRIGAHGIIIVYDITCRNSFFAVDDLMKELKKHSPKYSVKILFGNKCDLEAEREVIYEEGKEMASKYGMSFLEISAKTSHNVDKAFMLLTKEAKNKVESGLLDPIPPPNKTERAVFKPAEQNLSCGCVCF